MVSAVAVDVGVLRQALSERSPKPGGDTGLYAVDDEEGCLEQEMRVFQLDLATIGDLPRSVKPVIQFRYVFLPFNCFLTPTHSSCSPRAPCHPYDAHDSVSGNTASPNVTLTIPASPVLSLNWLFILEASSSADARLFFDGIAHSFLASHF